ncbi:PREDICTED: peptidyl-prolyl cis-trans isomerase FKBP11 [Dipodomys ordii]|uniref:Peptidyl-prolyl cis-trans isomerase FKBP11 n=1 Tax=Dipodomys ordii TaxID=10020 RepID=A0A1S3FDV6_DIPOR|nr:PREDICTED: peptidyl-prolyl cis-trans isomerase FKBP11 [Dipodomys ordii]
MFYAALEQTFILDVQQLCGSGFLVKLALLWPILPVCIEIQDKIHRHSNPALPSASPADAVVQYDVELVALIRANYWQKLVKGVLPMVGMAMVPSLLGLIGYHLYQKANKPKVSKKKLKEEKRNKSKNK